MYYLNVVGALNSFVLIPRMEIYGDKGMSLSVPQNPDFSVLYNI